MSINFTAGRFQAFDSNGDPLAGGLLYSHVAGTLTNQATYTTAALTTPNANPVVLDSQGRASVWLDPTLAYRMILKTSAGATITDDDNIATDSAGAVQYTPPGAGAVTRTAASKLDDLAILITDYGAVGDGVADDTAEVQAAIDYAETLTSDGFPAVVDGGGKTYGLTDQLINDSGANLRIRNCKFVALDSANWAVDPFTAIQIPDLIRTNDALWNRDLTNAVWVKTNATVTKTSDGINSGTNAASVITSTAGNGTVLQTVTHASALWVAHAFVKRVTGTGNVQMTVDGSTWSTLDSGVLSSTKWAEFTIPSQTLANPVIGFRLVTSGDAIEVDFVSLEEIPAGEHPIATPPMETTTAAVTRVVPSTFMLRVEGSASDTAISSCVFDCANKTGGVYAGAFGVYVDLCEVIRAAGIGLCQDFGGVRFTNNLVSGNFSPSGRNGICIYSGSPDGKFNINIARYNAYPIYSGKGIAVSTERGSTGLWVGTHCYNGNSSTRPDSRNIMLLGNGNAFVGNYLDNGSVEVVTQNNAFWSTRTAESDKNNSPALFRFWTDVVGDELDQFAAGGFYNNGIGVPYFAFETIGSGTWADVNTAAIEALASGASFSASAPAFVNCGNSGLGSFITNANSGYLSLLGKNSTDGVEIGIDSEEMVMRVNSVEKLRITASAAQFAGDVLLEGSGKSLGYRTGSGGSVTQLTSKATGVTLDKGAGRITMHNASLLGGAAVSFTLTNSVIDNTDTVIVNIASGATADSYSVNVTEISIGSARIQIHNLTGGALGEALVLNFAVIRGASA